jgi:hypothetical protein
MPKANEKHTALAVCEVCGLFWGLTLIVGTVYLTGWCNWSYWTWLGCAVLLGGWTCRWCPGHAEYDQERAKK